MNSVDRAAALYAKGDACRFDFAILADDIRGTRGKENPEIQELAQKIKRSVSRVYQLADVGRLWKEAIKLYAKEAEVWRAEIPVAFWEAIARVEVYGFSDYVHWFKEAEVFEGTVEQFRDLLPRRENRNPFGFSLRWITRRIEEWWHKIDREPASPKKDAMLAVVENAKRLKESLEAVERLDAP
jgi:hypothetical protein